MSLVLGTNGSQRGDGGMVDDRFALGRPGCKLTWNVMYLPSTCLPSIRRISYISYVHIMYTTQSDFYNWSMDYINAESLILVCMKPFHCRENLNLDHVSSIKLMLSIISTILDNYVYRVSN